MVERAFGDDLGVDAGLLADLAHCCLGGVFVGVDVPAGVEPHAELVVVDQQDPVVVVEDDGGGGEVADAGHHVVCSLSRSARWVMVRVVHSGCGGGC